MGGIAVKLVLAAGAVAAAGGATAQPPQKVTPPIAVYWMSASTQTGFGMPGMGGGRPDPGAMMRMMMGGGGAANRTLTLQLGSSQTNPAPTADHLPPAGLNMGQALPLLTPKIPPREPPAEREDIPPEYRKPQGRILIFWGCGEHARPGQPVVIDFATLGAGQAPAGLAALRGLTVTGQTPPSPSRNKTYGEWPNEKSRLEVPANGSLAGAHTVKGDYSPQIDFTLAPDQDFLGPLTLTTNARQPGGWVNLGWSPVANAQAYLATAMGGAEGPGGGATMVLWSSSETGGTGFVAPEYLSNGDISRLVANKTLMGPAARTCAVPKEVLDAMPQGMVSMTAYGGEANFVYPPRPADPKVTWNQQWAVKVRYRSATGGLLGMEMPDMGGAAAPGPGRRGGRGGPPVIVDGEGGGGPAGAPPPPAQPRKPKAGDILKGLGGLGGLAGGVGGLPFPH